MLALVLAAALTTPPSAALDTDRTTIRRIVQQQHGSTHVDRIIIHGEYALAAGRSPAGTTLDGLRTGRITRAQAIAQGGQFCYSWMLAPSSR